MKLLDCTLRDGGYYTNWDFENEFVEKYVKTLSSLPIEYIEIGYRSIEKENYLGKYYYSPLKTIEKIKEYSPKQKLAIMIDAKDCLQIDLSKLLGDCKDLVELIRIAIDPDKIDIGLHLSEKLKKLNYQVAINSMYQSIESKRNKLVSHLKKMEGLIDFLYIVDSYGGMWPDELSKLIQLIKSTARIKTGFHGHNNLELAFINSVTALKSGIDIIDSTILGMGRGAGNLKTELILLYMDTKLNVKMDFTQFNELIVSFQKLLEQHKWGTNIAYMTSGFNNLPQKDVMTWMSKRRYSISNIMQALHNKEIENQKDIKIKPMHEFISKLNCVKYKKAIIIGGGESSLLHNDAIKELSSQHHFIIIHSSTRRVIHFSEIEDVQILCLTGNEGYKLNYILNKNIEDSIYAYVLPPQPRKMGTYIPDIIKEKTYELSEIDFTDQFKDSPLGISLQISLLLNIDEVGLIGFDGYDSNEIDNYELMIENQYIINAFLKISNGIYSLTETKYENIRKRSIYAILARSKNEI